MVRSRPVRSPWLRWLAGVVALALLLLGAWNWIAERAPAGSALTPYSVERAPERRIGHPLRLVATPEVTVADAPTRDEGPPSAPSSTRWVRVVAAEDDHPLE